MPDSVEQVVSDLLTELRSGPQDPFWSGSYADGESLIYDVEQLAARITAGDAEAVERLRELFLPTGVLQETAITSGWTDEYMRLAERMDRATA